MVIRLLRVAEPGERRRIERILAQPRRERTTGEVRWMRRLIDRYECMGYARQVALGMAGAALHEFSLLFSGLPDSPDKQFIEALVTWVFERDH